MSKSFARPVVHSEYLKLKYGDASDSSDKKKKKKKRIKIEAESAESSKQKNLRIVDDDIDMKKIKCRGEDDDDEKFDLYYGVEEDKPIVDKIFDERPMSKREQTRWKPIAPGDETSQKSENKDSEKKKLKEEINEKDKKPANRDHKKKRKSGLSTASELAKERKRLKEEEEKLFNSLGPEALGKNAKSVFRDPKTGKVRDLEKEKLDREKLEKEVREKEAKEEKKFKEMSAGIKQVEEEKTRIEEELLLMKGPFARFEDDPDFDKFCREKEFLDDPMLALIRNERAKNAPLEEEDKKKKLKYNGPTPPPPNRFNIQPGHRWDGVDRSNGYERKYFQKIADKEATKEEAYRWATEDM